MEFLIWLKGTPIAEWVLYSAWANPILLRMPAVGMALVVGCGFMTRRFADALVHDSPAWSPAAELRAPALSGPMCPPPKVMRNHARTLQ